MKTLFWFWSSMRTAGGSSKYRHRATTQVVNLPRVGGSWGDRPSALPLPHLTALPPFRFTPPQTTPPHPQPQPESPTHLRGTLSKSGRNAQNLDFLTVAPSPLPHPGRDSQNLDFLIVAPSCQTALAKLLKMSSSSTEPHPFRVGGPLGPTLPLPPSYAPVRRNKRNPYEVENERVVREQEAMRLEEDHAPLPPPPELEDPKPGSRPHPPHPHPPDPDPTSGVLPVPSGIRASGVGGLMTGAPTCTWVRPNRIQCIIENPHPPMPRGPTPPRVPRAPLAHGVGLEEAADRRREHEWQIWKRYDAHVDAWYAQKIE
jgi:hypothetical protein